jgi:hypothetical protein
VLPAGIVCDRCNGYFAVKVEKPLLETGYFTALRFHEAVPSKRGRIPNAHGTHVETGIPFMAYKTIGGPPGIVMDPDHIGQFIKSSAKSGRSHLVFPVPETPPSALMERFMAKCGLEIAAQRFCTEPGWRAQTVLRGELDQLRRFARFGEGGKWPVHIRRIYPADTRFPSAQGDAEQVLFEYDLLYSDHNELFAVVAIFGMELAINLGGPTLYGYLDWLRRHGGVSPLYSRQGRYQP